MNKKIKNVVFAVVGACISGVVLAQPYPNKPISLVVPQAAGGTNDIVARLIAPAYGDALGTSIVVENKPGAGGNIGTQGVARSPKDGYTLLLTINSAQAINPSLYKNPGFDPVNDFVPLYYIGATPYVLVSPPGSPYKTLADVVAAAKKKPGELSYASAGNGTISHLLGAMLNTSAGIEMQHIPYKGSSPALADLVGGQVQLMFDSMPSAMPFIKAGKLRAIAVTTLKRAQALPELPTIAESGYPGFDIATWYGYWAPKGTPMAIVNQLSQAASQALKLQSVQDQYAGMGAEPVGSTSAEFAKYNETELAKWEKIVRASGAKAN